MTRLVLAFCVQANTGRMLLVGTGAYSKAPPHSRNVPEDYSCSIDPTIDASTYHQVPSMIESMLWYRTAISALQDNYG